MENKAPLKEVPFLALTIGNFKPNQRIRFFSFGESSHFLFDLKGTVSNDSIYIWPQLEQQVIVQRVKQSGTAINEEASPSGDTHFSFHDDGAVNFHFNGKSHRIRPRKSGRVPSGLLARLIFKSLGIFKKATFEDINSISKKYTPLPVSGLFDVSPVCLDIYIVDSKLKWIMPKLANIMQMDVCVCPNNKNSVYHFIIWQHSKSTIPGGDVVVYFSPE
jgi:hypothetical protein